MTNELQILTTREFNGIRFNCYRKDGDDMLGDFWATREQIGQLLGYENPRDAISKIHRRNKKRIDKFSRVIKIVTLLSEDTTKIYNFKGLLEICRYSQQPRANAVIDFLWQISDELRQKEIQKLAQMRINLQQKAAALEEQEIGMRVLLALANSFISERG